MTDVITAKIYKIVCNVTNRVYIGSTTLKYLSQRMGVHRLQTSSCTSHLVLESNDYNAFLVEVVALDERYERERWYILNTTNVVNKQIPHAKDYDPAEYMRDASKKHYYKNQEAKKIKNLEHYHNVVKPRRLALKAAVVESRPLSNE